MTITDEELTKLYNELSAMLLAYAVRRLQDYHMAADVVHDCYLKLQQQDYSKIVGHEKWWLFTVCKHRVIRVSQASARYVAFKNAGHLDIDESSRIIDENTPSPFEALSDIEQQEDNVETLSGTISKFSQKTKEIIKLRYIDELSYKQIAAKMGMTVTNVGYTLYDIHDRLSVHLPKSLKKTHNARKSKNRHSHRAKRRAKAIGNILPPKQR
jgi:RNA polymerase sigma factor (sigma-70 family)